MKKILVALIAVGLMVAPVFATEGGHVGHVDLDSYVVLTSQDYSSVEGSFTFTGVSSSEIADDVANEDIKFAQAPDEGKGYFIVAAAEIDGTPASSSQRIVFTVSNDSLDGTTPYALSGDDLLYPLTESGDDFVSAAAADSKVVIEDDSWADQRNDETNDIRASLAFVEQKEMSDSGSSGCDVTAIAPMAGLLMLPLIMLIKR